MTDKELEEMLSRVSTIVDNAHLPEDLRAEAFRVVWQEVSASLAHGPHGALHNSIDLKKNAMPEASGWATFSARVGLTVESLQDIYDAKDDGTFTVHVPTGVIPKTKSEGARAIALLVCGGRQATAEEWTLGDVIRDVCKHYSRFDPANHAANLAQGDNLWQIEGTGAGRKYKLRKPGWEALAKLIGDIGQEYGPVQ